MRAGGILLVPLLLGGAAHHAALPSPLATARTAPDPLRRVVRAWPVMGTVLTVTVWGRDTVAMLAAVHAARDSVRLIDSLLSTFRPESELSRLNAAAGGPALHVSPQTLHVLLQARRDWRLSGGAFDPTVGPLVRAWGFHGTRGRVPPRRELDSLRALVGYGAVDIDSSAGTVRLARRGMELDLGGIAKGDALDRARAALGGATITGGSVNLGGNVLVFGRPPAGPRWRVAVVHPRRPERAIGAFLLDSGAVATSGDYEHYYQIDGRRYAHLFVPRTGRTARGVQATTVVGPRGEWSDGLSAAFFLIGPARGSAVADSLPGIAAVWVRDEGTARVRRSAVVRSARARHWFHFDAALPEP